MKMHEHEFSIERMAKVLGVSRSGYYHFLKAEQSVRDQENKRLLEKIRHIHHMSFETYGSPRIHAELKANGESCSRKRVASLMKKNGIMAKMSKRFKVTTRQAEKPSLWLLILFNKTLKHASQTKHG